MSKPNFDTEGKKNDNGKLMLALLYPQWIEATAKKIQEGYEEYGYKNYLKQLDKIRIMSAAFRHFLEIMKGNWYDEKGIPHAAGVSANMMMLMEQHDANNEFKFTATVKIVDITGNSVTIDTAEFDFSRFFDNKKE